MRATDVTTFLGLVAGRRGHFQLESGHHGALWLELDGLFADPRALEPFIGALCEQIAPHRPDVICGALLGGAFLAVRVSERLGVRFCFTERESPKEASGLYRARYRLPQAFQDQVKGKRVAIVDDVMSAGSALRGTFEEVTARGALTVAAGALLVLGDLGTEFFRAAQIPVVSATFESYPMWTPETCPLCAQGMPVEALSA